MQAVRDLARSVHLYASCAPDNGVEWIKWVHFWHGAKAHVSINVKEAASVAVIYKPSCHAPCSGGRD